MDAHEQRAVAVATAMRAAAEAMPAPGLVWAIASGDMTNRRVTLDCAGGAAPDAIFHIASVTKVITTACTMALADDGTLSLDDPIGRWVPVWAERQVLREPHSELTDTVPPDRPPTVRDLLHMGVGLGYDFSGDQSDDPLSRAVAEAGILSSWVNPELDAEEWTRRVATLPMRHQPGARWLYQTSFDALTVVLESATGQLFEDLLRERILEPLRMEDTGFRVPRDRLHRVPALYFPNDTGGVDLVRPALDSQLLQSPRFPTGSTGLLSTAADLIAFQQMLLDGGLAPTGRVLSEGSIRAMRVPSFPEHDWGLGVGVDDDGRFGWDGGTGSTAWTDPAQGFTAVLLSHQGQGAGPSPHRETFWKALRKP